MLIEYNTPWSNCFERGNNGSFVVTWLVVTSTSTRNIDVLCNPFIMPYSLTLCFECNNEFSWRVNWKSFDLNVKWMQILMSRRPVIVDRDDQVHPVNESLKFIYCKFIWAILCLFPGQTMLRVNPLPVLLYVWQCLWPVEWLLMISEINNCKRCQDFIFFVLNGTLLLTTLMNKRFMFKEQW